MAPHVITDIEFVNNLGADYHITDLYWCDCELPDISDRGNLSFL